MNDGKSAVDFLAEKERKKIEHEKQVNENLKVCCKDIFNSVNGKYFLLYLKSLCLWNDQDNNINNEILIYKKGRRDIWAIIRNFLPKDILAQIEIYEEKNLID